MPLTLEFPDKKDEIIRLVIDRKNLIVLFIPKSESIEDENAAIFNKQMFCLKFNTFFTTEYFDLLVSMEIDDDSRHAIVDHVCESDKKFFHMHYQFKRIIDSDFILDMLHKSKFLWLDFISKNEYRNLRHIIHQYFLEQVNPSLLSPTPSAIENYYQIEKKHQLAVLNGTEFNLPEIPDKKNYISPKKNNSWFFLFSSCSSSPKNSQTLDDNLFPKLK